VPRGLSSGGRHNRRYKGRTAAATPSSWCWMFYFFYLVTSYSPARDDAVVVNDRSAEGAIWKFSRPYSSIIECSKVVRHRR
jgi:hypothetical protein